MFSDQPLYRAGALEPVAGYKDVIFLVDAGGAVTKYRDQGYSAFFGVQAIRPFFGGARGLFPIWAQGAIQAGYGAAPAGMPTGAIAANGGTAVYPAPVPLQLGSYGFVQARYTLEAVALAGPIIHDLDLAVAFGAISDYSLPQITGKYSPIDQAPSLADQTANPVLGANKALPAAYPQANPWDLANLTELYWFENNTPTFTLTNNGAITTAGTVFLRLKGFRYMLIPLTPDDRTWRPQFIAGAYRNAPPGANVVAIPTVPPTGTTTY